MFWGYLPVPGFDRRKALSRAVAVAISSFFRTQGYFLRPSFA